MNRRYSLPTELIEKIETILRHQFSLTLADDKKLARAIQTLSDFYIENPTQATPWREPWCQIAQLAYYLPLNCLRSRAVVDEGLRLGFFEGLKTSFDFGAGLGAASFSLPAQFENLFFEEISPVARRLHQSLAPLGEWHRPHKPQTALAVFSYSLTELESLPAWTHSFEALMIIEPSTREDGRKLLQIRQDLIEKGFFIWAPCLHQQSCPLFTESKTDWCHDRIHFDQPAWFTDMEAHLPFKNSTLTFSYLLASRHQPATASPRLARMTGDLLDENGKFRQLICRGEKREFLTWMKRDWKNGPPTILPRGICHELPLALTEKSNELRVAP